MKIAEKQAKTLLQRTQLFSEHLWAPVILKTLFSEKSWCNLKKDAPVSFILL